jgi:Secretion system C-terminal sorting domain/PKD domain
MKRILKSAMMIMALIAGWQQTNAQTCNACFTATPDTNNSTLINLDGSCSTPASFVANFEWIVDGVSYGSIPYAFLQLPFYTAGTHTITLVFSNGGCVDSNTQVITTAPSCNAAFNAYDAGNGYVYFSTFNYYGNGAYAWDFGDSSTGTTSYPSHQYATAGTYNVCCIYTDTVGGCADTFCAPVIVNSSSSGGGCNAVLSANSFFGDISADGGSSSYTWGVNTFNFYVNGTLVQSGINSYYYAGSMASGTYTVALNILDASGAVCDSTSTVVNVTGFGGSNGCYSCFYQTGITSDSIEFNASCSNLNGGSMEWNVDGAAYVAGPAIWAQTFTQGSHSVGLRIIDSNGSVCDSSFQYIYIYPPPCVSCLSITPVAGSTSDYVFDASCSSTSVANTAWFVNGQYVSTSASPTFNYSFAASGSYDVCVYTYDSLGYSCTQACSTLVVTTPTATQFDINGTVYKFSNSSWGYYAAVANAEAKVYLITLQPGGQLDAVDSTITNAFGQYSFQNKIVNDYRVKVALDASSPDYSWNIPTYYQNAAMWYDANVITLFTNLYGKDVYMLTGTNTAGPGFVSGNVFAGANKKARNTDRTEVTLMLVDLNTNLPVMYAKPKANGDYSFGSVPEGNYKLVGELLNRASIADNISITAAAPTVTGKNFVFTDNVVKPTTLTLAISKPSVQTNLSVLPNPAQNELRISTTATDGIVTVFDVTGRVVTSIDMKNATSARIDCSAWQAGIYIVEQATASGKTTMKVSKQ